MRTKLFIRKKEKDWRGWKTFFVSWDVILILQLNNIPQFLISMIQQKHYYYPFVFYTNDVLRASRTESYLEIYIHHSMNAHMQTYYVYVPTFLYCCKRILIFWAEHLSIHWNNFAIAILYTATPSKRKLLLCSATDATE